MAAAWVVRRQSCMYAMPMTGVHSGSCEGAAAIRASISLVWWQSSRSTGLSWYVQALDAVSAEHSMLLQQVKRAEDGYGKPVQTMTCVDMRFFFCTGFGCWHGRRRGQLATLPWLLLQAERSVITRPSTQRKLACWMRCLAWR